MNQTGGSLLLVGDRRVKQIIIIITRSIIMAKELTETKAYEQIQSLFGTDNVFADMDEIPSVEVIKTPSPALDRIIGVGGWPRGRLIQLAGAYASGKTLLALQTIAYWQSLDPDNCAAFLDAEFQYSKDWAESLGVDNDRVLLVKTNEASLIFQGLVGDSKLNKTTKKVTKVAGLLDMVESGQVIAHKSASGKKCKFDLAKLGVVVLDSIASLQTPTDVTSTVGKQNMALMARFMSVELKKLTPAIAKSNIVMLAINQVRVDPGKMFGNPETTPGGKALKHACSLMVELGPMSGSDNVMKDDNDEDIGRRVRAKVTKNRFAAPFKKGQYFVKFDEGVIQKEEELLEVGKLTGAFERPSTVSYIINGVKLTSKDKALDYIRENIDIVEAIVRDSYLNPQFERPEEEIVEVEGVLPVNLFGSED
jgi:recombination protein RecA